MDPEWIEAQQASVEIAVRASLQNSAQRNEGTEMSVQVPPNLQGGMPMQVQTPNGLMQVQIPPGLQPGMAFLIQVPQPTSSAPRNSTQRNEGAEEVAMQTSVSAAPREAQETQLDPDWIAARQASLEIAAREASLETQMDADWIAAREASLVEARRRAERGPSYQKELEQALALSRA